MTHFGRFSRIVRNRAAIFGLALLLSGTSAWARPKLLVVLVIDQFRADYLTRFEDEFQPARGSHGALGGFRYLMSNGAYYPFAEYDILQCMTGPGHSTILSGAYPYLSGIPLNDWYDPVSKESVYCVEDQSNVTVGPIRAASANPHIGTSPKNFIATTVGDELKNAGFPSKVVTVSLKDRAAILLGGHRADLALWFDTSQFGWSSSSFYLPGKVLPDWVSGLDAEIAKHKDEALTWQQDPAARKGPASSGAADDHFIHTAKIGTEASLALPYGLELTEQAAERAISAMNLGRGPSTDLLAVSFSTHDYVGHGYGPNSPEAHSITLADDRVIARLLSFVQAQVPGGMKNVVVALTGDHGVAPRPEYSSEHRVDAGRIMQAEVMQAIEARLDEKFGKPSQGPWVTHFSELNFYLNRAQIASKKLPLEAVEAEAKAALLAQPGFLFAFTSSELQSRHLPPQMLERQALKTWFASRSGDVIGIAKPFYIFDKTPATHFTSYSYDRTVPLILSGPGIRKGRYATHALVNDLAPTLSYLLGTVAPSLSEGRVLSEALDQP